MIPTGFIPAVEKGVLEAMSEGVVAGYPVKDVRVRLYDGSYHTVDSSEMAFKVAGSLAMRQALGQAAPVLLEPIMLVTVSVPEDAVGDVIGDLNSRRGRPLGMEPVGAGMTEVKAEVPMSEMLSYAPDLRSITGGQGEFTMEFLRYEEVPGHLAGKVVEEARAEREAVTRRSGSGRLAADARAGLSERCTLESREHQGHPDVQRRTPPAMSAAARCCGASGRRSTSAAARAGRFASCASRGRCTRAGSARARFRRMAPVPRGADRRRSLLGRLRASQRDAVPDSRVPAADAGRRARRTQSWRTPGTRAEPRRLAPGSRATCGPFRPAPSSKIASAVEHVQCALSIARTVAGVARSLGAPAVAVLAPTTRPSLVDVVVSWELCWYRYEVDLSDDEPSVRVAGQGYELDELLAGELQPNAGSDEHGALSSVNEGFLSRDG